MKSKALNLLEDAQRRLIAMLSTMRAGNSEEERAAMLAQQAFAGVLPQLPSLIEARIPTADAVIMTKEHVRELLVEFGLDILSVQTGELRARLDRTGTRR